MCIKESEPFKLSACCCIRKASHIDFAHEKRHMDVGGGGDGRGLAPVTFLDEKSWKISIVC